MNDSLDPQDWAEMRRLGHQMLDDMFDHLATRRDQPIWQPPPEDKRAHFAAPLPWQAGSLAEAYATFRNDILPHSVGNTHPGFMGWVHGGGTVVGMLAEMLAGGLNANVGGRNQMPLEVERQIGRWLRDVFGLPDTAGGIFLTGTSLANLLAVLIARTRTLGQDVRQSGLAHTPDGPRLVAYTSAAAHGCIAQAMDLCGLGTEALRRIPLLPDHTLDTAALAATIMADREAGLRPFMIMATAGSVDTGAIDPLAAIAGIAREHELWLHVDGAYGALGMLSATLRPRLHGIEQADSIAFDFHKWGQVPYDAGYLLVRDQADQLATFSAPATYLQRSTHGLAAGGPWPCDLGPDLSRSFRALKTWFTLQVYGLQRLGEVIDHTCALARMLGERISAHPELELLAPVSLNIVCFRYRPAGSADDDTLNALNDAVVIRLHEEGRVAPSTTTLAGRRAIRAALVNHRTDERDIDTLIECCLAHGRALYAGISAR